MKALRIHRGPVFYLSLLLVMATLLISGALGIYTTHSARAATISSSAVVNWTDVHQTIDGFGVSDPYPADYLETYPEPARSEMVQLLFSQDRGAGFSILRSEIGSGDGAPANTNTQTIEPSQGNFTWNVDAGQVWLMHQAQGYGVNQFESTAWSPPGWMKTNGSPLNGGSLRTDQYQAYADYLAAYVQGYHAHFGVDITAISPSNEPDQTQSYQSANWTGQQFEVFIRDYLKPTFVKDGITTKIVMPEAACWSDVLAGKNFAGPTLNDTQAAAGVDIVAGHDYCNDANVPLTQAQQLGKHQWETEVSSLAAPGNPWIADGLQWATRVHKNIVDAGSNAWFWWLGVDPANINNGDNQGLLYMDSANNNTFEITKRLFAIGNYSRFIRPGYVRIGATESPNSNVLLSAYKDPNSSKLIVVAINSDTANSQSLSLTVNGFSPNYLTPYVTSTDESLEQNTSVPMNNGSATVTLLPGSITTFVGTTDPAPTAREDPLADFSQTHSHTSNLSFDSSNWANFAGDTSRLVRSTNTDEKVVYQVQGGSTTSVRDYYWQKDNGVLFQVSADGTNYTNVTPTQDTPQAMNGGDWFETNYSIAIPAGDSYLQIEIPPNPDAAWTPQISHVTLSAAPGGQPTPTPTVPTTPVPTTTVTTTPTPIVTTTPTPIVTTTPTPTPNPGGTLLDRTGWTASASRSASGNPPANALDGNTNTSWSTGGSQQAGDYYQVDMQATHSFSKIVLDNGQQGSDFPRGYAVYVSNDGSNWGSAIATGTGSGSTTTITFPTQSARYIKVALTAGDGLWWWSIDEFTVYS